MNVPNANADLSANNNNSNNAEDDEDEDWYNSLDNCNNDHFDDDDDVEDDDEAQDEEPLTATTTDFKTISADCTDNDNDDDDQRTSISDYRTLSPDCVSQATTHETQTATSTTTDYDCKVCLRRFPTLQACFRHDLVEHSNQRKMPQKAIRMTLKTMLPVLEQNVQQQQAERVRVQRLLKNCQPGLELHELLKFYCISDEKANHIGLLVCDSLQHELMHLRNLHIHQFGSIVSGLMTKDSDIDIYISANHHHHHHHHHQNQQNERFAAQEYRNLFPYDKDATTALFNRINSALRRSNKFDEIVTIRGARVPIIKCRHIETKMKIDINCSCPNSVVNSRFLNCLLQLDVRLRALMRFLKIWSKQLKLIGRGNMTSYCLTTLVLFYLQQPQPQPQLQRRKPIVPSIKQLQMHTTPQFVEGINYAYDLYGGQMTPLPLDITTHELIRGFFGFYRNFDFSSFIVAPYLGQAISLADMRKGVFCYGDLEVQLKRMRNFARERYEVQDLDLDRCMIVQDPFQLNHNISRGVTAAHLEYFRKCIEYANNICIQPDIKNQAELYERLLFDVIIQIGADARALRASAGKRLLPQQLSASSSASASTTTTTSSSSSSSVEASSNDLIFTFTPSRVELRTLVNQQLNFNAISSNVHVNWLRHYIEAIYAILAFVYRLKVELQQTEKQNCDQEADNSGSGGNSGDSSSLPTTQMQFSWWKLLEKNNELILQISGQLDLWNGRNYNRENASSFMDYQLKQTQQLWNERRNNKAYAVDVKGLLHIKPSDGYKSLTLALIKDNNNNMKNGRSVPQQLQLQQQLSKKDPLRKFFNSLKNSMQNFNLKEKLQAENNRKQKTQSQV